MKKLIAAKDIETLILKGEKVLYVDGSEIITPSAQDLIKNNGIVVTTEAPSPKVEPLIDKSLSNIGNIDTEMMLKFIRVMMDKGLLEEMIQCLKGKDHPFKAECASNGLKVVRGNTVKMDTFDTGNLNANVQFQELVSKKESKMSAGFLIIENSKFDWELTYEEIDYVIEGTLTVEIDGKTYTAYAGDVLFVPSGSKVVWGSPDKARVFYATYPANWADLL
ncbi:cupin domain-containing protein [Clostridium tepidum]|jgi:ethanolamine utilization protein EutQ|uniref:Ethanolamine utilization protein EutQ n=1 Tax=Clostridium tepidum TaxID=1962263 RepID=A0A1S9IE69_9CLOT|nr:cupin domain-containing protein [Clostridium tepidum]MCR1934105.1 cupin domain-containing protein [Clostridium tepidum]MDU6877907.1 cupin domain-containing protein [Clostridium botulinum]OOO63250.1 ethanolamine utilization protein EutQ [Clostridium tepidum]OOO68545.1 ethanolamine utilization protein EutQ [Clostridium tepidum]